MANPTTNYGFVLPTPTDLVTDLPADFDVALQGVDTRLKALQPGTTLGDLAYSSATANTNTRLPVGSNGQVLAVVAGVPAWQNGTTGDIEGVTAGVGITGGGTSGTVTVTNDMATTITAAGDIVVGTGSGTYDNLPIGTTAQVLTADTTVSPYKVKWATASTGGFTTLASGSLSGNDLTLSSISQSYKQLRLVLNDFYVSSQANLQITVNGDSGNYYTSVGLRGQWNTTVQTTDAYSAIGYNGTYCWLGNGANIQTNNFANTAILDFPNYASTDTWKTWNEYYFIQTNSNGTSRFGYCSDHYYPTTAAAISSIKIKVESSNTFSGGTYTLLGLS